MSGFRDMVASESRSVFLNTEEFAELHIVHYDGEIFDGTEHNGIPVVLCKESLGNSSGTKAIPDDYQGLYQRHVTVYFSTSDLNGIVPEKGKQIEISTESDGRLYYREYTINQVGSDFDVIRLLLEAVDE